MRWAALVAALVLGVVVAGCGPFPDQRNLQDRADAPSGVLGGTATVAERFVAGCDGLSAVDVQIAVYPSLPRRGAQLVLDLAPADEPSRVLGEDRFDEATIDPNAWIELSIPPVEESAGRSYLLRAWSTAPGESAVTPWATTHWSDPANQRFADGVPRPGALVYRAWCDSPPLQVARDTIASVTRNGFLWPVALLLAVLPGLGVVRYLTPAEDDLAALVGGATGWTVLLAPLALAAFTPLHGVAVAAFLLPLLALVPLACVTRRGAVARGPGPRAPRPGRYGPPPEVAARAERLDAPVKGADPPSAGPAAPAQPARPPRSEPASFAPAVLGLVATALALGLRAVTTKDLIVPAWGDSVQHSYVVQLILANGGVPATYGPLMPTQVYDYHFGFQALAAYAAILAGATAPSAVLAVGQVLDALICAAIYRFARDLTSSRWAGAIAAVLVALVTVQPTYYASWGRYTELAGLVALPAAFAAVRAALARRPRRRDVVAAVVACAAIILVHPRVAIFLAALVAAEAIVRPGDTWTPGRAIAALGRLAAIGTTGLILISPWIARLWEAHLQQLRIPADVSAPIDFPVGLATSGDDRWVAILGLLGLALALARGRRVATLCAVWFGLVFLAANPASFHLPYSLTLDNGALAIAAFLPAAVFAGDLGATAPRLAPGVAWPRATPWVASVAILLLGLSQAPHLVGIVNPVCILFRLGDRGAMRWAAANTPPDSRFLVNGFVWAPGHYMGTDAGYWLPVLAGRRTTLPLLFYRVGPSDEVRAVNDLAARVEAAASNPAEIARLSAQEGARYVFIGTRGGDLDPGTLVASGRFRVVYGAEGAWILELVEGASTRSATSIGVTPTGVGTPREANAAGLRSSTSG